MEYCTWNVSFVTTTQELSTTFTTSIFETLVLFCRIHQTMDWHMTWTIPKIYQFETGSLKMMTQENAALTARHFSKNWTQRRNETPTLQTRATICRHMLTHPWDWANAPLTLIAKLHAWCICKMLLWIDNATNDLLNQDFFRSTFSSERMWV